ncbi:MAG: hypothetical protein IJ285_00780 [Clostridia bacterium]|nr:hypothetical protein [Clostridia bacterium]
MLFLEIFKSEHELEEYFSDMSCLEGRRVLMAASTREAVDRLVGNGCAEWYKLDYKGNRSEMVCYLSKVKIECFKNFFLHINMPTSGSLSDLQGIMNEVCTGKNCGSEPPVLRCTTDKTLEENEVEVTVVVPVFNLKDNF